MAETAAKPTVRMSEEEAWAMVEGAIVGVFTSLRADGRPVALPVWHVVLDRKIYVTTPPGKKVTRARNDPRCSYLVESGERWIELRGVHVECTANVIEPEGELAERIRSAIDEKYAAYRAGPAMPSSAKATYRKAPGATIELTPQGRLVTWDNGKLVRATAPPAISPTPTTPPEHHRSEGTR